MLEQNYAVATVQLTTPGDGWADGKREVPESLRWGHAEALCGFLLVLCLGLGTEPTAALAQHNSVGWPATVYVGTSDELVR